jgi:hypothetical protein
MKVTQAPLYHVLRVCLVAATFFCVMQYRAQAADDSYSIALSLNRSLAHEGWLPAEQYAEKIYDRLTYFEGEAHYLVFDWQDHQGRVGRHACVVFRDSKGQYWAMDNRCAKPIWLASNTVSGWLKELNADKSQYTLVNSQTQEQYRGAYARLDHSLNFAGANQICLAR